MAISEYEVENLFIERLGTIGYKYVELKNYTEVMLKSSIKKKSSRAKALQNCRLLNLTDFAHKLKTKPFTSRQKFCAISRFWN